MDMAGKSLKVIPPYLNNYSSFILCVLNMVGRAEWTQPRASEITHCSRAAGPRALGDFCDLQCKVALDNFMVKEGGLYVKRKAGERLF